MTTHGNKKEKTELLTPSYCQLMARYNQWQNGSLITAADQLPPSERAKDRGAFFGSIVATFNHIYWDDALWLARFEGDPRPELRFPVSLDEPAVWREFKQLREIRDAEILAWAEKLTQEALTGDLSWYPDGGDILVKKPRGLCCVQIFNHQTHHRGQIHAMLTAAGAKPEATDVPMLV